MGELTTASYPGLPPITASYPELSWKEFAQGRVRAECCKVAKGDTAAGRVDAIRQRAC